MSSDFSILVVDDDDLFRETLVEMIRLRTPHIFQAASAEQGLELYRTKRPALLFVDVNLKRMSGIEFVRLVGKDNPRVLAVVITGHSSESVIKDAFKAGASDFLVKPIQKSELDEVLLRSTHVLQSRQNQAFRPELFKTIRLAMSLPANIRAVSPSVSLILSMLEEVFPEGDMLRFELAIHEAIRNAFEHGSLGLDAKLKEELCEAGNLESVLEVRSADATSAGKKVDIEIEFSPQEFTCHIVDNGDGFNWREAYERAKQLLPSTHLSASSPRGRGLFLIQQFFDSVEYNEKGNAVVLRKALRAK